MKNLNVDLRFTLQVCNDEDQDDANEVMAEWFAHLSATSNLPHGFLGVSRIRAQIKADRIIILQGA